MKSLKYYGRLFLFGLALLPLAWGVWPPLGDHWPTIYAALKKYAYIAIPCLTVFGLGLISLLNRVRIDK